MDESLHGIRRFIESKLKLAGGRKGGLSVGAVLAFAGAFAAGLLKRHYHIWRFGKVFEASARRSRSTRTTSAIFRGAAIRRLPT